MNYLWLVVPQGTILVSSAIVLSIQRAYFHCLSKCQEANQAPTSPYKKDVARKGTFSNRNSLRRIYIEVSLMAILSTYVLVHKVQHTDTTISITSSMVELGVWLYCLVLSLVSWQYLLPHKLGWTLNVHMCLLFIVQWIALIIRALNSDMTFALWISVLIGFDLVYLTSNMKQGSPFLDQDGRIVSLQTVESLIGNLFFSWLTPLVNTVNSKGKNTTDTDLPALPAFSRAYNLFYVFRHTNAKKSLLHRIVSANKRAIALQFSLAVLTGIVQFGQPVFLKMLLLHIQHMEEWDRQWFMMGVFYVFMMAVCGTMDNLLTAQLWFVGQSTIEVRIRAMLNVEIYHKALRQRDVSVLSNKADEEGVGNIVNLMSTDTYLISTVFSEWFSLVMAPVQITVGLYLLYSLLGWSSLLGLSVMLMMLPLNQLVTKYYSTMQEKLMKARDKRVSLMNELLQGIRQIKFFAWESNWTKRIIQSREIELSYLGKTCIADIIFLCIWHGTPLLITSIAFFSFTKLQGQELTAPIAFTAIAVYHELESALTIIPGTIIDVLEMYVSLDRVQKYLAKEEVDNTDSSFVHTLNTIKMEDATITWPTDSQDQVFQLKDLNIVFPKNQISLICGATGSGKTLLMLSLLGEAKITHGYVYSTSFNSFYSTLDQSINIASIQAPQDTIIPTCWILPEAVAYVPQTAWLQNDTIKNNILFGLPFVSSRYQATIYACALDKDISYLNDGDETEIGEKGITLSGGQKARVALARTVYSRAQNIFLDDVLSAVDAHTARHLYHKCLLGPLVKGRTIILITHHVSLCIQNCAYVVLVKDGRTQITGSPLNIKKAEKLNLLYQDDVKQEEQEMNRDEVNLTSNAESNPSTVGVHSLIKKSPKVLVEEEKRFDGTVKLKFYKKYLGLYGHWFFWTAFLSVIIGYRTLDITSTWWVKQWAQSYEANKVQTVYSLDTYLCIFAMINMINIFLVGVKYTLTFWKGIEAGRKLYNLLLERIFGAPLRFFDTVPVGRLLNRFSKDAEKIDRKIPFYFICFLFEWVKIIGIALVTMTSVPLSILPMTVVTLVNVYFGSQFVACTRDLQRMESVSRSPIFSQFGETISGITTIRAFGMSQRFMMNMLKRVDANSRTLYYNWSMGRWVSTRISMMGSIITFITGVLILLNLHNMDAPLAGFCLTFVSTFTDSIYWGVRRYSDVENVFNSVERVVEYLEIEQEPKRITDTRPPLDWPQKGAIKVDDLHVQYAPDLPTILKGVSFSVKPREKIGIVGRTGSGKSTLALSFFRFIELLKGQIVIDGVDISTLGTSDLRSNLTIIPQDPTLFSGTLRSNMDPFDQFEDQDIFDALRRVHLIAGDDQDDINTNVFKNLSQTVSEGGHNFSQGQKQLLCLARALLKKNRVLLMDEATASVDFETDRAIQKTINREFADCTVLCIAHRLNTVIEYDRILVLDHGQVLEFASPLDLLQDVNSTFYRMCSNSGQFDNLLKLAKAKHELLDVS